MAALDLLLGGCFCALASLRPRALPRVLLTASCAAAPAPPPVLQYIGHLLGWKGTVSEHFANTNPHPFNATQEDLEFVWNHNKNDAQLYQAGLARFVQQVALMDSPPSHLIRL